MPISNGALFRRAVIEERPLQVIGAINAYVAIMAKERGYRALYLSGAGVANACYGLPDLGMTSLDNVLEEARRIIDATDMPLLVDVDTGWGDALMVERTARQMSRAGVAAIHIEDQAAAKRCGHRGGKKLVEREEMAARIEAAAMGRCDEGFVVMARSDALASEGLECTIDRCLAYKEAGADMLFLEAATDLADYRAVKEAVNLPLLANMTEFGRSPLKNVDELRDSLVDIALYPLSLMRAMNLAALGAMEAIRKEGTQEGLLAAMQTREELYHFLNYKAQEARQR